VERAALTGGTSIEQRADGTYRVTCTWGEEKYTPIANSYSTVTVGPYAITFDIPAASDPFKAAAAFNRGLQEMAELEREQKIDSFIEKFDQIRRKVGK
jgi:hypothetical protein